MQFERVRLEKQLLEKTSATLEQKNRLVVATNDQLNRSNRELRDEVRNLRLDNDELRGQTLGGAHGNLGSPWPAWLSLRVFFFWIFGVFFLDFAAFGREPWEVLTVPWARLGKHGRLWGCDVLTVP